MFLVGICWVAFHPEWGVPLILIPVGCVAASYIACTRCSKGLGGDHTYTPAIQLNESLVGGKETSLVVNNLSEPLDGEWSG